MLRFTKVGCEVEPAELTSLFDQFGLNYFLGGSRRFGYENEASDTDFFVLAVDDLILTRLGVELMKLGFRENIKNISRYGRQIKTVFCLGKEYHVVVHHFSLEFFDRKENHDCLGDFLEKSPDWVEMARAMKRRGKNGTEVFNFLLGLARGGCRFSGGGY